MKDKVTIETWELDDNDNLIVTLTEPEDLKTLALWSFNANSKNFLSKTVLIKDSAESEKTYPGFLFSVHEFRTLMFISRINGLTMDLTERFIMEASRTNCPKIVKTVYIRKRVCENEDEEDSEFEKFVLDHPELSRSVSFESGHIEDGDYILKLTPQSFDSIVEIARNMFPGDYIVEDENDQSKTQFVLSGDRFDVYRLLQHQLHENGEEHKLSLKCIFDSRIERRKPWDFEGIVIPDDYEIIADGERVECSKIVVRKKIPDMPWLKAGNFVTIGNGAVIGRVSEVNKESVALSYHVFFKPNGQPAKFFTRTIEIDIRPDMRASSDSEMKILRQAMLACGYIIAEDGSASKKYPWLGRGVSYYKPEFSQVEFCFYVMERVFAETEDEWSKVCSSKSPVFKERGDCEKYVSECNASLQKF